MFTTSREGDEISCFSLYFPLLPDLDAAAELSALEEISDEEAVSISVPSAMPPASTSLKDYVDQSETISKLVQLGNETTSKILLRTMSIKLTCSLETFGSTMMYTML